jgi:sterol desaturase/sphingolipid hydroxylase (fatty acid hydroxylase superfamily)
MKVTSLNTDRAWTVPRLAPVLGFVTVLAVAVLYEMTLEQQLAFVGATVSTAKLGLAEGGLVGYLTFVASIIVYVLHAIIRPLIVLSAFLLVEIVLLGPPRRWRTTFFALSVQVAIVMVAMVTSPLLAPILPSALPFGPLVRLEQENLPSWLGYAAPVLLALASVLVMNFAQYWIHRAQHAVPILWRFHAVHHSIEDMDAMNSYTHPLDNLLERIGFMLMASLIGFSFDTLIVMVGFISIHDRLLHTRAPINFGSLGWLFVDNRYHFLHHSSRPQDYGRNYSSWFSVWDRMFGTYLKPHGSELPPTGVGDIHPPRTVLEFLLARMERRGEALSP